MIIPIKSDSDLSVTKSVFTTSESIQQDIFDSADLSKTDKVESVHLVRKRLKLYRAFLKLFRNCSRPEKLEAANHFLRDQGRNFSELRDAHVRNAAFETMLSDRNIMVYSEFVKILAEYNRTITNELETSLIVDHDIFNKLKNALNSNPIIDDCLKSADLSAECIAGGLADTFEMCCNTYYNVKLKPSAEQMHEWRKRVKDLQYQYELTVHLRPAEMEPLYEDILAMTELLGLDQDLNNLITWILQLPENLPKSDMQPAFHTSLVKKRKRLKAGINHLGKALFTIDPDQFRQRLKPIYSHETG